MGIVLMLDEVASRNAMQDGRRRRSFRRHALPAPTNCCSAQSTRLPNRPPPIHSVIVALSQKKNTEQNTKRGHKMTLSVKKMNNNRLAAGAEGRRSTRHAKIAPRKQRLHDFCQVWPLCGTGETASMCAQMMHELWLSEAVKMTPLFWSAHGPPAQIMHAPTHFVLIILIPAL